MRVLLVRFGVLLAFAFATTAPAASSALTAPDGPAGDVTSALRFAASVPATVTVAGIVMEDGRDVSAVERRLDVQHLRWIAVLLAALLVVVPYRRRAVGAVRVRPQSLMAACSSGRSPPSSRTALTA